MKRVDVVIGAGYGDEGKGETVYDLVEEGSVVVRFNGGAQAGHTTDHDGVRHVHSHFGCGTLKGCPTYLSKFFVCHPVMFRDEWAELSRKMDGEPDVYVSPDCPVTTPYDAVLDILGQRVLGHGSCGVGFGETLERQHDIHPAFRLTTGDISVTIGIGNAEDEVREVLEAIRDKWVPARLEKLGVTDVGEFKDMLTSDRTIDRFLDDCRFFNERVVQAHGEALCTLGDHFVFEGAQGLMLSMDSPDFPHVSRSHTGLRNALEVRNEGGLSDAKTNVHYVSRTYTTRHGRGPLPYELKEGAPYGVVDRTNVDNEHQGPLRYSYLNLDTILPAIRRDLEANFEPGLAPRLRLTCLDQLPAKATVIRHGKCVSMPSAELPQYCFLELQDAIADLWNDPPQHSCTICLEPATWRLEGVGYMCNHCQDTYLAAANEKMSDKCPDCGRPKARDAADAGLGWCPKWWALYDGDAKADCERAAKAKRTVRLGDIPGVTVLAGDPDQKVPVREERTAPADDVKVLCPKCQSRDLTILCDHCDWENNGLKSQRMAMLEDANRRANLALGNQAEELGGIIEKQKRWIDDLQAGMYINCVYCGHRYGPEDEVPASMADVLKEHVESCPDHPMSKLKAELEQALKYKRAAEFSQMSLMEESNGRVSLHESSESAEAERQRTYEVINENVSLSVNNGRMLKVLNWIASNTCTVPTDIIEMNGRAVEVLKNLVDVPTGWTDEDRPIPEDELIAAAHPTETKDHESYEEALRMVGAKRSKYALVDLVNWLLHRLRKKERRIMRVRRLIERGGPTLSVSEIHLALTKEEEDDAETED